jgi:hypothetical protein
MMALLTSAAGTWRTWLVVAIVGVRRRSRTVLPAWKRH